MGAFIDMLSHVAAMTYNAGNHLEQIILDASRTVYYQYDSSGQRVRKTVINTAASLTESRYYVGSWEVYRRKNSTGAITLERETLHLSDDTGRVALIDTRTMGSGSEPAQLMRYQLSNHLSTATLELDDAGEVISYEEYYPYGSTSFLNGVRADSKRYRYTGKERDEESGFYYHGARYYAPWLCRWLAADPLESKYAGLSPYNYSFNNPVKWTDSTGMEPDNNIAGSQQQPIPLNGVTVSAKRGGGFSNVAASDASVPRPERLGVIDRDNTTVVLPRDASTIFHKPWEPPEQEVLMADIYGNGHMGPKSVVSAQVRHIELEHAFKVADDVRGGFGGALGYTIDGERGAAIGAMADNMAQGLFFQRVEPVVGARFSAVPRAKAIPKTELPVIKTTEPTGRTFSLSSQQAAKVNPAFVNNKGTTVLGHYPEYMELATQIGARRFQIPTEVWNKMTVHEQWEANLKFLDRMILRGDNIRLATPLNQVKPGSYFEKELKYLFIRGYKLTSDGRWLTK